ncbi:MAG: VCBS repeat-containing protein [Phycisphaerales bacterium]|nr:VCBS repeat-containing protein [Phycisphaerales bacterium]
MSVTRRRADDPRGRAPFYRLAGAGGWKQQCGWSLLVSGVFVLTCAAQEHGSSPPAAGADEKLSKAPGEQARQTEERLGSKVRKFDPREDAWEGEVLNEVTGAQLNALGKLIEHPADADEAHLGAIAAPTYAGAPLRPSPLVEAFNDGVTVVRRAAALGADLRDRDQTLTGAAGLGEALRGLAEPLAGCSDVHVKFKIISVIPAEKTVETRAYYQAWGHGKSGVVQLSATWTTRWVRQDGSAPPRLEWIGVEAYEETAGPRNGDPMFTEATRSVLGGNPSFEQQLLPSLETWLATMDRSLGLEISGHEGIVLGDVNGDGLDDLFVCQPGGLPNRLYVHQPDGTARDATREAGLDLLEMTHSALMVDFDNDGDQDLAITISPGVLLYANDGAGKFKPASMIEKPNAHALAAADYDLDGNLDLYVGCYFTPQSMGTLPVPYHDANNGAPNFLLRNDGGLKFSDVTEQVGLNVNNTRFTFAASWEDFDNDGDPDLYVANDFGRNNLYRNDKGFFRDVAGEAGVEDISAGMGVSWGDYNRDGLMDLCVSNMFSSAGSRVAHQRQFKTDLNPETKEQFQRHAKGNSLFENAGDGTFRDVSETAAVTMGRWAWGACFTDLNNDGLDDLVVPNGFISSEDTKDLCSFFWRQVVSLSPTDNTGNTPDTYTLGWVATWRMVKEGRSWSGYERNCAFLNTGGPQFADVSAVSGLDFDDDARAVALVDWDFDGRRDLWLANRTGPRVRFMHNVAPTEGSFLTVGLTGRTCNRDAVGARLEVHLKGGGAPYIRTLRAGEGYLAQSSKWIHFGLPKAAEMERLVVRWPDGKAEEIRDAKLNGIYRVAQGEGWASPWSPPPPGASLTSEPLTAPPVSEKARIVVASRLPLPEMEFTGLDGKVQKLPSGGPVLLHLWASWCPNCLAELKGWSAEAEQLRAAGVRIVALSVDEDSAKDQAREVLKDVNWPLEAGFAPAETVDVLDLVQRVVLERDRRIPLPTSFLVDAAGRVTVIYRGPVTAATLLSDAPLLGAAPVALRVAACPFPGTWLSPPPGPDLKALADELGQSGHPRQAAQMLAKAEKASSEMDASRLAGARMNLGVALHVEGKYAEAAAVFEELLKQQPDHPDILNNLGNALGGLGKFEESLKCFSDSLRLKPDNPDTLANMSAPLRALGRHAEAESALRRAIEIYPQHTKALNDLSIVLIEQKRTSEALPLLRKVIELDPGNIPAIFNYAVILGRTGQTTEAIDLCRRVVQLDPNHVPAHTFLGVMFQRQHRPADATAAYEEVLRLAPENEAALHNLAVIALNQGDLAGAERYAGMLDAINPQRAAALFTGIEKAKAKAPGP